MKELPSVQVWHSGGLIGNTLSKAITDYLGETFSSITDSDYKSSPIGPSESGFHIFVIPEWNGSFPGFFKVAVDEILRDGMNGQRFIVISYGANGGIRAGDHTMDVLLHIGMLPLGKTINYKTNLLEPDNSIQMDEILRRVSKAFQ